MVFPDDCLKPNDKALQTLPFIKEAGYKGPVVVISGAITCKRVAELKAAGASASIQKEGVDRICVTEAIWSFPVPSRQAGQPFILTLSRLLTIWH